MATHLKSRTTNRHVQSKAQGVWSLLGCAAVIACVWLVLLPWAAERPGMKSHILWLDRKGINPAAMFYTELEVMETILRRQPAPAHRDTPSRGRP